MKLNEEEIRKAVAEIEFKVLTQSSKIARELVVNGTCVIRLKRGVKPKNPYSVVVEDASGVVLSYTKPPRRPALEEEKDDRSGK